MAHTLVDKAMPVQLQGHGFNPQWGQSTGPHIGSGSKWKKIYFFWFFFCALMLSPLLRTPKNAGVMQRFRPVGPSEGRG